MIHKTLDIIGCCTYNGPVQITIHRNIGGPGGGCVELKTDKTRLLIDPNLPLESPLEEQKIDAILISRYCIGQYGFFGHVHKDVPIFLSRGTNELIEISGIFTSVKKDAINLNLIDTRKAFTIGDIKLTPYAVDNSALDALAFLIEAEGKRLLYSIDPRGYNRKSVLFKKMLEHPPKDIEGLLMEGPSVLSDKDACKDEIAAQAGIEEILKKADNVTFLFTPSENIDRLVSAYKACLKTNSVFVIDVYTAYLLDRLRKISKHIPPFNWRNIRVKFYKDQADTLAGKVSTQLLYHYNTKKIEIFEINDKKNKILMLLRDSSMLPDMIKSIDGPKGAKMICSMREGHLTDEFKEYCRKKGLILEYACTNGYAEDEDKEAFAGAVKPKMLIRIPDDDKSFNI